MNLPALQDLVVMSHVRVLRAQHDVSFQREIVSSLQRAGRDATQALDMLAGLERIEAALVEGRDRIAAVAARFAPEQGGHLAPTSVSLPRDRQRSPLNLH